MCWAVLIDGKVLLHWFELGVSINQDTYLNVLKTIMWPKVRNIASRRDYWFQQDGATPHTANRVREWLTSKFGDRLISRFTDRPWPARSPDLSPLDFWFWSECIKTLRKDPPKTLEELKSTVDAFANLLSPQQVESAVKNILPRARACIERNGGAFEYRLKKVR